MIRPRTSTLRLCPSTRQTSIAAKLALLRLQRGVEDSQAQHQDAKRFYGLVKELNPQLEQEAQHQVA